MKKKLLVPLLFGVAFLTIAGLFSASLIKTSVYNSKHYESTSTGDKLFTSTPDKTQSVSFNVEARDGTWGKIFDFDNVGLTENNYTATTYDFYITNNTNDVVNKYSFKMTFHHEAYIAQAWNGSVEIHQFQAGVEHIANIPDLRVYDHTLYDLKYFELVDTTDKNSKEYFIEMRDGDYLIYHPSESKNALELPIKAHEGTVPGIIIYAANGENINNSVVTFEYTLFRLFTKDPLFLVSAISFGLWLVILTAGVIMNMRIKKYKDRHERDNEIINESIETFIGFIDAKDSYTQGHSKRVATYTTLLAKEMGYSGEELDKIYYIALLHDAGKIGVPDNILGKPGKLTKEEFEVIKSHTTRGGEILSNFKSLPNVGQGALYHHERYDGTGYPKGLKGEEIPLIARIICVADSFDAMNTSRVYRKNLTRENIISELETHKGTQFDPQIADIMLRLIKEGKVKIDE